jgi:hypothetical protein
MVIIPLTRGKFALIDDEDATLVGQYRWCANPSKSPDGEIKWYAIAGVTDDDGRHAMISMHRLIMNARPDQEIDHRNGNGLDNRRDANLRPSTSTQNKANRRIKNRSGYKGVFFYSDRLKKPWMAKVTLKGGQKNLGYFATAIEAALAYDAAARARFGAFAHCNFPTPDEQVPEPTGGIILARPPAKINKRNTSGFRGVTFDKVRHKWKTSVFIGHFDTAEAASVAHESARTKLGISEEPGTRLKLVS